MFNIKITRDKSIIFILNTKQNSRYFNARPIENPALNEEEQIQ